LVDSFNWHLANDSLEVIYFLILKDSSMNDDNFKITQSNHSKNKKITQIADYSSRENERKNLLKIRLNPKIKHNQR
jgi:hypothetical protein